MQTPQSITDEVDASSIVAHGFDQYVAKDGKHYWNCWTLNYQASRDGYFNHAFCEEDRTGKTLCGVVASDGGGLSIPNELDRPSCKKCWSVMDKRGALGQSDKSSDTV